MKKINYCFYSPDKQCPEISVENIFLFLKIIDDDFPVKLSQKQDLLFLSKKFIDYANMAIAYDAENNIIGIISGYLTNSQSQFAFISVVGVHPLYRGKGVATQLMNLFLNEGKKYKISGVHLYANRSNYAAVEFYKKLHFIEVESDDANRINDMHLVYYYV